MQRIGAVVGAIVVVIAVSAGGQTSYLGEARCGPPEPENKFGLEEGRCEHPKPGIIADVEFKDEVFTGVSETTGSSVRWQGLGVVTMANGDKFFQSMQCTSSLKPDGTWREGECCFTTVGGSGRFRGLKGEGVSKGTSAGGFEKWVYEGRYTLAE